MVTETTKNEKRLINCDNHPEATIETWQAYFQQIFSKRNESLEGPFMWLKVIEKATIVGEAIRKSDFNEAAISLARVFCWLCGFCSKNEAILGTESLSDIVWYKYPKVCSTCAVERNDEILREIENKKALRCRCDQTVESMLNKHIDNKILDKYRRLSKPTELKLDEWVEMFNIIFGHRLHIQSLDSICFHFVEEVGEVTTALRNYKELEINKGDSITQNKIIELMDPIRKNDLEYDFLKTNETTDNELFDGCQKLLMDSIKEELADVFSWLCALIIKLLENRRCYTEYEGRYYSTMYPDGPHAKHQQFYEQKPLQLSSIIYLEYADGCPVCKNLKNEKGTKCICDTEMSPTII